MDAPLPMYSTDLHRRPEGKGERPIQALEASIALQLAPDSGRSPGPEQCHSLSFHLAPDLMLRLQTYQHSCNGELALILLAAFAVLLHRYSREEQLQFRINVHHVNHSRGLADATAMLLAPLELDMSSLPGFAQLLLPIAEHVAQAGTQVAAAPTSAPLEAAPRVTFRYQRGSDTDCSAAAQPSAVPSDLCLEMLDTSSGLQVIWHYAPGQFSAARIAGMQRHWQNLLDAIALGYSRPVAQLPLLSHAELQQQLGEWNATVAAYPATQCIHHLFEEQARVNPRTPALVFGPVMLSYHGLNRRANQLAHAIQQLGGGTETLIALHIDRSLEMFIGILGILKAGCAYLPLDPEYPQERLAFMLADARVPILLTTSQLADSITSCCSDEYPRPQIICLDSDWLDIAQHPGTEPLSQVTPDNLAYVIYTSGSTGRPKGTQLTHRGLCNLAMAQQQVFPLGPAAHILQFASSSFDASVWEWVMALTSGSALHIAHQETLRSLTDLTLLLREQGITIATLPPSLLALLPADSLPALQTIITAGEACTRSLVLRWAKDRQLYNAYGPTETTICASWYRCDIGEATNPPIGRPLPNMQLFILDSLGQPVPVGVPGELHIGGFSLARGYLNRPDLSAARFIDWTMDVAAWSADALPPAATDAGATTLRLYKTGDLARFRADGNVEFLGRIDDQVKLRGFRIELGEIETVLRQHPQVRDAVVQLREDVPGVRRLVAYLVTSPIWHHRQVLDGQLLARPLTAAVQAYLSAQLPEYMLPTLFVHLNALPLTPNGKVDRRKLPHPRLDAADQPATSAPRSREEHLLAEIWAQVLGLPHIGIDDNFFALGGHSLAAAHAVTLVGQQLGKVVPLRLIYTAPTIAAFAQAMSQLSTGIADIGAGELAAEVVLDPAITAANTQPACDGAPRAILLTGATGFLGAFLLQELLTRTEATVYCLVRAHTNAIAARRLEQVLDTYQIDVATRNDRIVPIAGDLAARQLGLSTPMFEQLASRIDVIYHAGANVHYLHPYANLKPANVDGTVEILRLACHTRVKPLHYVSTIAVAIAEDSNNAVREDAPLGVCQSTKGYDQSKWVAEGILHHARARGVPVNIYRPGRITGHRHSGAMNANDFFIRMLAGCVQLGMAPRLPLVENLVTVDYVVQAIVHLSQQVSSRNRTFHILSPYLTRWHWVVATTRMLGYELEEVSYQEWHRALMRVAPESFGQVFHNLLLTMPPVPAPAQIKDGRATHFFAIDNTLAGLANSGIICPPVDKQILGRILAYGAQHHIFVRGCSVVDAHARVPALVPQHCSY